jgi:hypothetical protein
MTDFKAIFGAHSHYGPARRLHKDDGPELSDDDLGPLADQVADRIAGNGDGDDGDNDEPNKRGLNKHEIDALADLVCESTEGRWQRPQALHFMMHTARGASMVHRLRKAINKRKEINNMPESFQKMIADMGIARVAKAVVERGHSTAITEREYTEAVTALAQKRYPILKPDVAFAKLFGEQSPEAATLRRAYSIIKNFPMMAVVEPVQVGGADFNVNEPKNALAQLQALAEEQVRRNPTLTVAQAFARVYSDTANAQLAAAERSQNRPRATSTYQGQ